MADTPLVFRSLMAPAECVLLLVAPGALPEETAGIRIAGLHEAAETHDVPALALAGDGAAGTVGKARILSPACANPLADPEVHRALAALHRARLILGGARAETMLTFTGLSALEAGFHVHLLRDMCLGATESLAETAVMRLIQAGAVPVTIPQVIAEWGCGA